MISRSLLQRLLGPQLPDVIYGNIQRDSLIEFQGPDACAFLHAQSTTDLRHLPPRKMRRLAFSNPKGRVLALGTVWKVDEITYQSLFPTQQIDWILEHLGRYRLRSRVEWTKPVQTRIAFAIAPNFLLDPQSTDLHTSLTALTQRASPSHLNLDGARAIFIGNRDNPELQTPTAKAQGTDGERTWNGLHMLFGEAYLDASSRGLFLPQQLNLMHDETACLSKGCYPGQEIITRVSHRGKVKRALQLFVTDTPLTEENPSIWDRHDVHVLQRLSLGTETWCQVVAPQPLPDELSSFQLTPTPN